jgi:hypothetical protein
MGEVEVERERGTLSKTLPKHPEVVIAICHFAATGASILCCHSLIDSRKEWPALVVGSALSSLASIGGIIYADSAIHSLLLGLCVSSVFCRAPLRTADTCDLH